MLEARNITVNYEQRIAVSALSLTLLPGKVVAVIGPNGAGKSTMLRSLNGGLKPTSGSIFLDDQPLRAYSRRAIAKRIAVVAQEAEVRFPVTVLEFVLGGRFASSETVWGWEAPDDLHFAQTALLETDLTQMSGRLLNELSGGERQRAVLARALATDAPHLLLDEPTANLDLSHQAAIISLVRKRCDTGRVAAVVITHDVNLAAEFADYVLLLNKGETIAYGPPSEVLTTRLIAQTFQIDVVVDAHPVSGLPRITPVYKART